MAALVLMGLGGLARPSIVAAASTSRPGFDCAHAIREAERLVCGDAQLGDYDRAIAATYKLLLTREHASTERFDQRAWVKTRDACSTRDCVLKAYADRLTALFESVPDGSYTFRRGDKTGTLHVLALGGDTYAFHVDAFFQGSMPGSVNVGEASGVVRTKGGAGTSENDGCTIRLQHTKARAWSVEVAPGSVCGVGHSVSLEGSYSRP